MRPMTLLAPVFALPVALLLLAGCAKKEVTPVAAYNALGRIDFNKRAAEELLPLFWSEDTNNDGTLQPGELAVLWGLPDDDASLWVANGAFTPKFVDAYARLGKPAAAGTGAEGERLRLVRDELAQGVVTLVHTDLEQGLAAEQQMVQHLMRVALLIEKLYARQNGVLEIEAQIPREDVASRAMFNRNQSPFCESPRTENVAACSALAQKPARISGLYPAVIQSEPGFCQRMEKAANGKELTGHFNVVTGELDPASWKTVPFPVAWAEDMAAVAKELRAAADGLGDAEPALVAYLRAAADSFASNDWEPANRAWVAMNAKNSRWYTRIGPDEVYFDPCAWKGGFALQLARINPDSIAWQDKLEPHKAAMEQQIAKLAGAPYKARNVQFKLPDFIDVVLNAGDQRKPTRRNHRAVAAQLGTGGRLPAGALSTMTNLYTDPDSVARAATLQSAVFCKASDALHATQGKEGVLDSLLHEAAHNLGPSHDYSVAGKTAPQAFGGPLASTLEELKAQNSSLYLLSLLQSRGVLQAGRSAAHAAWRPGLGLRPHLARHVWGGWHTAQLQPRGGHPDRLLHRCRCIELAGGTGGKRQGHGLPAGGLRRNCPLQWRSWKARCWASRSRADRKGAEALLAKYVDDKDDAYAGVKAAITERYLRSPKASFVYSVSGLSAKAQ